MSSDVDSDLKVRKEANEHYLLPTTSMRPILIPAFIRGSLEGALFGVSSYYLLNTFWPFFRRSPTALKSYFVATCIFCGGVIEQNRRARAHVAEIAPQSQNSTIPLGPVPRLNSVGVPNRFREQADLFRYTENMRKELRHKIQDDEI
ncbi:uncharacterized protein V1516DRAFT_692621 [Lipomyces oligophaga]|uniref:uncharacterized protein n=1 Tax=Lipomyces oligophaga TaxID=45792 RepID=UPI0034CDCF74